MPSSIPLLALALGAPVLAAQAEEVPGEAVEGCQWRWSQALRVRVPVPLGWVFQDLSLEAEPRAELYITPRGVPPSSPAYLFELYGGVRIVGMDLPPQYRGGFPRRRFLEIRKASIQRYEPPPYLEKKRCYALGAYECFEFTDRPLAAVATRIHVFAFNDNLPAGFEIFAVPPRGDGEAQAGLIPRILHRLQLPASTP